MLTHQSSNIPNSVILGVELHRHIASSIALVGRERGLQRVGLLQLVVASTTGARRRAGLACGVDELKKRNWAGSPTTSPISSEGTSVSVPSSMPIGHDAQRPQRPRRPGDRQPGRLDADVVRPGRAAADPHAAAMLGLAVVGRAAGHGVVQIVLAGEHLRGGWPPGNQLPSTSKQPRCGTRRP